MGKRDIAPIIIGGLKRLEYRGYDSAGIAGLSGGELTAVRAIGRLDNLETSLKDQTFDTGFGIGHTRWATHGEPNLVNAHPHLDGKNHIAVVHNGIIENFEVLKKWLEDKGHEFHSATDTEVIAHLISEFYYTGDLAKAVRLALHHVDGTYGIAVISKEEPDTIVAARKGSPLVIGLHDEESFLASDVAALIEHTDRVIYLQDGEMAILTAEEVKVESIEGESLEPEEIEVTWDLDAIERGGFEHFMLKEIFEQPNAMTNSIRGRLDEQNGSAVLSGLNMDEDDIKRIKRIVLTACGTSWHAGLMAEYMLEEMTRIPVEVDYASEFRLKT